MLILKKPKRISCASVALIPRTRNGQTQWLLQWNAKWQEMNLIAGHREAADANDLACLVREIHEELFTPLPDEELRQMQEALRHDNEAYRRRNSPWQDAWIDTITRSSKTPLEYDEFSASAKCLTHYIFHIYHVTLQTHVSFLQQDSFITFPCQTSTINEWASAENIQHGITAQGLSISKTTQRILNLFSSLSAFYQENDRNFR